MRTQQDAASRVSTVEYLVTMFLNPQTNKGCTYAYYQYC
jgi:hypothetical protein